MRAACGEQHDVAGPHGDRCGFAVFDQRRTGEQDVIVDFLRYGFGLIDAPRRAEMAALVQPARDRHQ